MEPESPSKSKLSIMGFVESNRIAKVCLIFVVIVLVLGGICYGFVVIGTGKKPCFTVVVDCGSTGTRVNVYEWRVDGGRNGDLPDLLHSYPENPTRGHLGKDGCQYHCMQTEPGLDKFVGNYSGVKVSLDPLIRWVERLIPNDRRMETPIFVLATAGLRRLKVEDAKRVLDDVELVLRKHSFMWRRNWIRVLSGREEAYYGWVALNYKMGYLSNLSWLTTLGLLDLGGSSLQIATESDIVREDTHLLVSKIGSFEHQLMAYSLPAFGLNEAFDRTVAMLIHENTSTGNEDGFEVRHPCLSSKFIANYSCSYCSTPDPTVRLVGDPSWEKCKILAQAAAMNISISNWSKPRLDSGCRGNPSSDGKNVLAININPYVLYHALSGFFAVYNMLNLTGKANLTEIQDKAHILCSTTWDDLSNAAGSQYCFKVLYLASLIEDGLCLGKADIIFGPGDISWTLGASLVEGEDIWRSTSKSRAMITPPHYMDVIYSPISLFIILVLLLFVVYHSQIKLPMLRRSVIVGTSLPHNHSKHRPH